MSEQTIGEEKLTLEKALKILEIKDIDKIKETQLKSIRKKAFMRWHPDKIAHKKPSEHVRQEYENNTKSINIAVDLVRAYLTGELHSDAKYSSEYQAKAPSHETTEDILRRNAANMQNMLQRAFAEIREKAYKTEKKLVELSDGFTVREILMEDLKDNILVVGIMSIFGALGYYYILVLIGFLISSSSPALANVFNTIISIAFILQLVLATLLTVPLARFWLPPQASIFGLLAINIGVSFYSLCQRLINFSDSSKLAENISKPFILILFPISIVVIIGRFFSEVLKWLIVIPAYYIAVAIFGDKRLGVVEKEVVFFAGVAEQYVESLLNSDIETLDEDDLLTLSHLYGEYKNIWQKWAN